MIHSTRAIGALAFKGRLVFQVRSQKEPPDFKTLGEVLVGFLFCFLTFKIQDGLGFRSSPRVELRRKASAFEGRRTEVCDQT